MLLVEKEKNVLPHHHLHQQQHHTLQSFHAGMKSPSLSEETRKHPQQQPASHKMNTVLPPDISKPQISSSPNPGSAHLDSLKQKSRPDSSQSPSYPNASQADLVKAKAHAGLADISKPKPNTSPEVSKHKMLRYSDTSPPPPSRLPVKIELAEPPRSGFKPVRLESGAVSTSSNTKSPLIIKKNEPFTVYRDPALVRSDAENSASATVSSNHVAAYLHPHLHTLHSPHSPCLTPASHPHAASHLLAPAHTTALPHPHLLPPTVLPAMAPPAASLHPRLDSPGGLGHLALPHQQQYLQVCLLCAAVLYCGEE